MSPSCVFWQKGEIKSTITKDGLSNCVWEGDYLSYISQRNNHKYSSAKQELNEVWEIKAGFTQCALGLLKAETIELLVVWMKNFSRLIQKFSYSSGKWMWGLKWVSG